MASERILELLRRPSDPDEHEAIRELWKVPPSPRTIVTCPG